LAITTLTVKFDEERTRLEGQLNDQSEKEKLADYFEKEKKDLITEYEERLEGMDFLLDEVKFKEEERKEMEERLEEMIEYEDMVEGMVTELQANEKKIEVFKTELDDLQEEYLL
jgi:hypothetical protein